MIAEAAWQPVVGQNAADQAAMVKRLRGDNRG
jgi:hypothetical protein